MKNFALSGSLSFLNLSQIFQLLDNNSSTGILRVISRYSEIPGVVYFKNGRPVNASAGSLTGLDAVYSIFGWVDGDFEFSLGMIEKRAVISQNAMKISLEAMKMLDEGLIEKLGPISYAKVSPDDAKKVPLPLVKGPLVDYMYVADEEDYSDGETIVKQGRHGNWLWVVLAGTLEIRKETPKGQIPVLRIGTGSFVGSLATFLVQGSVRSVTVVALGEVQLGVLDSQRLSRENAMLSSVFKKLVKSLDKRYKQCANKCADLYLKKKPEDPVSGKKQIIKQGESKDGFFMIEEGGANIVRQTEKGSLLLAKMVEGDFIGKASFINMAHEPGLASVFASENVKLKNIDMKNLLKEYEAVSLTMKNMLENVCDSISAMTENAGNLYDKT